MGHLGEEWPGDDVDDHVETVVAESFEQVDTSIDDLVGAQSMYGFGFRRARNGDHFGPASLCELHGGGAHTPDAPLISTRSAPRPTRCSIPSAVE